LLISAAIDGMSFPVQGVKVLETELCSIHAGRIRFALDDSLAGAVRMFALGAMAVTVKPRWSALEVNCIPLFEACVSKCAATFPAKQCCYC